MMGHGKGIYVKFLGGNLSSCPCSCTPKDILQKKQELYILYIKRHSFRTHGMCEIYTQLTDTSTLDIML